MSIVFFKKLFFSLENLRVGGKRPTLVEPISGMGIGDIPIYAGGAVEIRDTNELEKYQIKWVYCGKKGGSDFYIADRNILVDISWNALGDCGLASEKQQVIDGVSVKLSLPTGGCGIDE